MKIGIIGSGSVGQALGAGLVKLGHQVKISSRNTNAAALEGWQQDVGSQGSVGTFSDAAEFGETVIVATKGTATEKALELAGPAAFSGKTVIDVTNPLTMNSDKQLVLKELPDGSCGETVQRVLADARVVKAFNTVNSAHMFRPQFPGGVPDMFFCGNDAKAKAAVAELLKAFGWNPVDIGKIDASRLLEPVSLLGVRLAMNSGNWNYVFQVVYQDK